MNKILLLFGLLLLTGCSADNDTTTSSETIAAHTVEPIHPMREPDLDLNRKTQSGLPATQSRVANADTEYKAVVTKYTSRMNDVINEMSTTMDTKTAEKNYQTMKNNILDYEQKKQQIKPTKQMEVVETHINQANKEYLGSMNKIVTGLKENDVPLKEDGFKQFSKAHVYLNMVSYEMSDEALTEAPTTEAPSTEDIKKEIFTAEQPTTESTVMSR